MPQRISSITRIVHLARLGRIFILVDDENRENEGDFVVPSCFATQEKINFMITHGRGLLCTTVNSKTASQLNLRPMVQFNNSKFQTNFTQSINLKSNITTGISAIDRARTILAITNTGASPENFTSPGHVFPLIGRNGGPRDRAGHTEASLEIMKMASLPPSATICEIIKPDGNMGRMDYLFKISRKFNIEIGLIQDLLA